jgi:hypothetical protein
MALTAGGMAAGKLAIPTADRKEAAFLVISNRGEARDTRRLYLRRVPVSPII